VLVQLKEAFMDFRKIVGALIIVIGLFALLHNFYVVDVNSPVIISLLMLVVGGLCFRFYFAKDRSLWLLIIALITFFWGLGILTYEIGLISFYFKNHFLLLGIGFSFVAVYFYNTKNWWAIIPGGCILVVFIVDLLDELFYLQDGISAFLVFVGIGLIFFYLYLIHDEKNRLGWAIYPAIILILIGLFQLYFSTKETSVQIVVAVLLILIGILLLIRPFKNQNIESEKQIKNEIIEDSTNSLESPESSEEDPKTDTEQEQSEKTE
jgi:hypothetical protein